MRFATEEGKTRTSSCLRLTRTSEEESSSSDGPTVILMDLPTHVRGFTCLGSDFMPCIVINSRLSFEQQQMTFRHEMHHIDSGEIFDDNYREYGDAI